MDSHRRHELQDNSLYRALQKVPGLLVDYGAYILLGGAVIVAFYYFLHTRRLAAERELEADGISIYSMTETISAAEQFRQLAGYIEAEEVADRTAELMRDFNTFASVPETSQRPRVRARALRLRGDFYWTLATFPAPAEATTQAATQPATQPSRTSLSEEALDALEEAESAYRQVLQDYPDQIADNVAALFGLAAIAEQRGEFEEARQHYDVLVGQVDAPEGAKALAKQRRGMLEILALNPRLAVALPTTQPSTQAATQPATQPSTLQSTQPSGDAAPEPATQAAPESQAP